MKKLALEKEKAPSSEAKGKKTGIYRFFFLANPQAPNLVWTDSVPEQSPPRRLKYQWPTGIKSIWLQEVTLGEKPSPLTVSLDFSLPSPWNTLLLQSRRSTYCALTRFYTWILASCSLPSMQSPSNAISVLPPLSTSVNKMACPFFNSRRAALALLSHLGIHWFPQVSGYLLHNCLGVTSLDFL